jgi:hypothetical protein
MNFKVREDDERWRAVCRFRESADERFVQFCPTQKMKRSAIQGLSFGVCFIEIGAELWIFCLGQPSDPRFSPFHQLTSISLKIHFKIK